MLKYIMLFFYVISSAYCSAQNLVPNGDFEYYTTCPTTNSQVNRCIGWRQYDQATSDYMHSCHLGTSVGYLNSFGYQLPASGNGYMGGFTYHENFTIYKEHPARQITPLVPGEWYEVSMSVSLSDESSYATDDLGAFFYVSGPAATVNGFAFIPTPQISYRKYGVITDTGNWVRVADTFRADSAYSNIVLGGFDSYTSMNRVAVPPVVPAPVKYTYYYYDSIYIRNVSNFRLNYGDSLMCTGDTIDVPYSVMNSSYFLSGNIFTLQLSDANGDFSSPVNIGFDASITSGVIKAYLPPTLPSGTGYKLRLISSNKKDTSSATIQNIMVSHITPSVTASVTSPLCEDDTAIFSANSTPSVNLYIWDGPGLNSVTGQSISIQGALPGDAGQYIVTGVLQGCRGYDTVSLDVIPLPYSRTDTTNSPVCVGDTIKLYASASPFGTTQKWTAPDNTVFNTSAVSIGNAEQNDAGKYIVTHDNKGCKISDTIDVVVNPLPFPAELATNAPLCEPATVEMEVGNIQNGATYSWFGMNNYSATGAKVSLEDATVDDSGYYFVVADIKGCKRTDSVWISILSAPIGLNINGEKMLCVGDTLMLHADNKYDNVVYTWTSPDGTTYSGKTINIERITILHDGIYTVIAELGDCSRTVQEKIDVIDPRPEIDINDTLCHGDEKVISLEVPGATYTWQDGSVGDSYTIKGEGEYIVNATTYCGVYSDTVYVTSDDCECDVFIPSAFTPNNDGLNDKIIPIPDCDAAEYNFMIVNRFGEVVFRSEVVGEGWDGVFRNQHADVGVYHYLLKITGRKKGKSHLLKGDITLIR